MAKNYKDLPEEVRRLLSDLSERKEMFRDVSWALALNFNKIPENVRNELLYKLLTRSDDVPTIAELFKKYSVKIPDIINTKLF